MGVHARRHLSMTRVENENYFSKYDGSIVVLQASSPKTYQTIPLLL